MFCYMTNAVLTLKLGRIWLFLLKKEKNTPASTSIDAYGPLFRHLSPEYKNI
jgi:hypothetical protein